VTIAVGSSTRVVALLGHPVAHSLSPRMHNAAFAALGLDWVYAAFDVAPDRLEGAVRGMAALGFAGANVTAPHKLAAAALDIVETDAPSVNILRFVDGRIEGWTSDAAILDQLAIERPVVIGDGGAATAFAHALRKRGVEPRVFARRGDWPPDVDGADVIVNATAARHTIVAEVAVGQTLVDLPYPASATAHVARAAGARVLDGLDVLVAQGAVTFEFLTGVAPPIRVMRRAVRFDE
jgi:shikimate dehydrogenase